MKTLSPAPFSACSWVLLQHDCAACGAEMTLHDEVEIEDMDWSEELQAFTYQCPCGDLFQITMEELAAGARRRMPGCSAAFSGARGVPQWAAQRPWGLYRFSENGSPPPPARRRQPAPPLLPPSQTGAECCCRRGDCHVPLLLPLRASHL